MFICGEIYFQVSTPEDEIVASVSHESTPDMQAFSIADVKKLSSPGATIDQARLRLRLSPNGERFEASFWNEITRGKFCSEIGGC